MALLRVYANMDANFRIALPRGVCKALDIKPGDKLEMTMTGANKAKKLLVTKQRGRCLR